MSISDDFGRVWRWTFGSKQESPEAHSALRRLLEHLERVARGWRLSNRNKIAAADRYAADVAREVDAKVAELRKAGRSEHGIVKRARELVAADRAAKNLPHRTPNAVKKAHLRGLNPGKNHKRGSDPHNN